MVVKAWFNCSTSLADATLALEIQKRRDGKWRFVDDRSPETFEPVRASRKYETVLEVACAERTFRARARMSACDTDGTLSQSKWYESRPRTDPCGGG